MVVSADSGPMLAVDWGTTNRRVFLIENGAIRSVERDDRGASVVTDFEMEIAALRRRIEGFTPLILAGMVGSTIGWRVAPYVPVPAGLAQVAEHVVRVDETTFIVPGLCDHSRGGDVMRGEETLILGAIASGMIPQDALVCQPGTHSKWAVLRRGRIEAFTTAMTGELFDLVVRHSILRQSLTNQRECVEAFRSGVREGSARDLAAGLFGIRARAILYGNDNTSAARSYISGLLIGAEVSIRIREAGTRPIYVLASGDLADHYAGAISELGASCEIVDADRAFAAGVQALMKAIR